MAPRKKTTKRKTTTSNRSRNTSRSRSVKSEQEIIRDKEIIGIIIIAVSVLLLLNFILAPDQNAEDVGAFGVVSLFFIRVLRFLAGQGAITVPIFLLGFGILVCAGRNHRSTKAVSYTHLVCATAVRVPVYRSHSESINIAVSYTHLTDIFGIRR